jgi:hypothetical protein
MEKVMVLKKSAASDKADFERVRETKQRSSLIGDRSESQRQRYNDTNDRYIL